MRGLRLLVCAAALWSWTAAAQAAQLSFGVVPQQSPQRLEALWGPLLETLSAETGVALTLVTAPDIPTFEACLARGAFDVAYMNPLQYVVFHEHAGYRAFARRGGPGLRGVVVARAGGPVTRLEDLDGEEVVFPAPGAFGATILTQAEMRARDVTITPRYLVSHDSVFRSVALGLAPAGGAVRATFDLTPEALRRSLVVVHETAAFTPHAFAARPGVAPEVIARLREAMVATDRTAPAALRGAGLSAIVAAEDADWNDVRDLRIDPRTAGVTLGDGAPCLTR